MTAATTTTILKQKHRRARAVIAVVASRNNNSRRPRRNIAKAAAVVGVHGHAVANHDPPNTVNDATAPHLPLLLLPLLPHSRHLTTIRLGDVDTIVDAAAGILDPPATVIAKVPVTITDEAADYPRRNESAKRSKSRRPPKPSLLQPILIHSNILLNY